MAPVPTSSHSSRWRSATLYLVVVILTLAAVITLLRIHQSGRVAERSGVVVLGVLNGEAEWRAFQNRLLSPALVIGLTRLGLALKTAIWIFHLVCLLAAAVVFAVLLRRLGTARRSVVLYTTGLLFGFLILQDPTILYVWDGPDLIVFTLLAFWALDRPSRLWPLLVLFAIELLNRESALFISVYIAMLGLGYDAERRRIVVRDLKIVALGLFLTAAGALYTKLVRDVLFARVADASHQLIGNHFVLLHNFTAPRALMFTLPLVIAMAMLWRAMRPLDERRLRYMAMFTVLVAGGLVFGITSESRTLLVLIPFFLLSMLALPPTRAEV